MNDVTTVATAVTHQLYATGRTIVGRNVSEYENDLEPERDRGAVSLEQVLWFVAAGVSVAVIAAILWGQIKDKADDPIISPSAP
jgi:hypothetical protein